MTDGAGTARPTGRRGWLRPVLLVMRTDLLRRVRNRSAIITGIIGPLAMAAAFSLLLGGTDTVTFTIGLADADGSPASRAVVTALTAPSEQGPAEDSEGGRVQFELVAPGEAAAAVDDDDLDAAIVLPPGFGAAAAASSTDDDGARAVTVTVLHDPTRSVAGQVARSVADEITAEVNRRALVGAGLAAAGAPRPAADAQGEPSAQAVVLVPDQAGGDGPDLTAYYGAAMFILFLYFTVGFVARSLVVDRDGGILGRLMATPLTPAQLIMGRTLAVAVLGVGGFVVVWLVTSGAFGADWGPPAGVLAMVVATVLAIAGLGLLVSSLGRTERQVESYTALVAFVLALIGGNFIGPGAGSDILRQMALYTPNGQALAAFTDLGAGVATVDSIARAAGILLAIGLVTGVVGLLRIHRTVFR